MGLSWFDNGLIEVLRLERAGLARGEIWRLLSGHVAHLDWQHAALNMVALVLVVMLFGSLFSPAGWLLLAGCTVVAIDAGLWWLAPHVTWYVGLSGGLHGVVAAAAVELTARRQTTGLVLLVLIVGKLAWEQSFGPLPGSGAMVNGRIVTEAHLFGAFGGLVAALLIRSLRRVPL